MKRLICILVVLYSPNSFAQKDTTAIKLTNASNKTFSGLRITNVSSHGINLIRCTNITIENCTIEFTAGNGVNVLNSYGVTIRNCYFKENQSGVYAQTSQNIVVENCNGLNFNGPMPRGQFVQFNGCTGGRVSCNYIENVIGESYSADVINMFNSKGAAESPILIENNFIKGGGPMESACGILVGDDGGDYIIVRGNVLVNSVASGIAAPAGTNLVIENNKLYGDRRSFSNGGILVWKYERQPCANNIVRNNQCLWYRKDGVNNSYYIPGTCINTTETGNSSLGVSDTMAAPNCAGVETKISRLSHLQR